jgi:hypothetical protein
MKENKETSIRKMQHNSYIEVRLNKNTGGHQSQWLRSVILATQEAEIRRIVV